MRRQNANKNKVSYLYICRILGLYMHLTTAHSAQEVSCVFVVLVAGREIPCPQSSIIPSPFPYSRSVIHVAWIYILFLCTKKCTMIIVLHRNFNMGDMSIFVSSKAFPFRPSKLLQHFLSKFGIIWNESHWLPGNIFCPQVVISID